MEFLTSRMVNKAKQDVIAGIVTTPGVTTDLEDPDLVAPTVTVIIATAATRTMDVFYLTLMICAKTLSSSSLKDLKEKARRSDFCE